MESVAGSSHYGDYGQAMEIADFKVVVAVELKTPPGTCSECAGWLKCPGNSGYHAPQAERRSRVLLGLNP